MPKITDPEEFLAHFGVPGMKWGKHNSTNSSSEPSARQVKREQYKKDLGDARATLKAKGSLTDAHRKALKTHANRKAYGLAAGTLAVTYGPGIAMLAMGQANKGLHVAAAAKRMKDADKVRRETESVVRGIGQHRVAALKFVDGAWKIANG